jgi:hypothetical protein
VSLWTGDLAEALLMAEAAGGLTERLVAQAAGVSQAAWRRAAAAFATQLAKEGNALAASEYYLACHQVRSSSFSLVTYGIFAMSHDANPDPRASDSDPTFLL